MKADAGGDAEEADAVSLFDGGGELGDRMRALDWSRTALGPVSRWPQSLKTCVRIILTSRQPMFVWWGEELINLYNDAYRSIVGGKHPAALGQPASVVWREIWDQVGPRAERAMRGNRGTYDEALLLIMERHGYQEETYYTFSYSPVPNERGGTGGILCANTDDTQRIIGERRLAVLREIASRTVDARRPEDTCAHAAARPGQRPARLALRADLSGSTQHAGAAAGRGHRHPTRFARRRRSGSRSADSPWPVADVMREHCERVVEDLASLSRDLPTGAWSQPPSRAVVWPLAPSGKTGRAGVLIVGLNPFRPFDESYRSFVVAGGRPDLGRDRQRAGLRRRAPAGRGAGRDRSRQDGLLLERQPRVPDPADVDARSAGGRAGVARRRAVRREPARPFTATRCGC